MIHGRDEHWYETGKFIAALITVICLAGYYYLPAIAAGIVGGYL